MGESTSIFNDYIEDGTQISSMSDFFGKFESLGKILSKIKKYSNDPFGDLKSLMSSYITPEALKSKLNSWGISDSGLNTLSTLTGGALSTDSVVGSLLSSSMSFLDSIGDSIVNSISSNVYVPEEVYLASIKAIYMLGEANPNANDTVLNACLDHDMPKVLEWLDDINKTEYDINITDSNSLASIAARKGSFKVALYIMNRMLQSYNSIKTIPVISGEDKSIRDNEIFKYEQWFVSVFKNIIVFSYGNFDVSDLEQILDKYKFILPNVLGSTDEKFHKLGIITSSDINVMARLHSVESYDVATNTKPIKTYIIVRNKNIKKIYVRLANYNKTKTSKMVNKPLYDRLRYPIFIETTKALSDLVSTFNNSPLGKFLALSKKGAINAISEYTIKIDPLLFKPYKQNTVWADTSIPITTFTNSSSISKKNSIDKVITSRLNKTLPILPNNLRYDDFEIICVDDNTTFISLSQKMSEIITSKPHLKKILHYTTKKYNQTDNVTKNILYIILYSENINLNDFDINLIDNISNNIIAKKEITQAIDNNIPLESVASSLPQLNDLGIIDNFSSFYVEYKNLIDSSSISTDEESDDSGSVNGINYSSVLFYTSIILPDGSVLSISDIGLSKYNYSGKILKTFGRAEGLNDIPLYVGYKDGIVFVIAIKSDKSTVMYYSTNDCVFFIMDNNVDYTKLSCVTGTGVTKLSNIVYFKTLKYDKYTIKTGDNNNIIFLENNNVVFDLTTQPESSTSNGKTTGISILSDGRIYSLIENEGVFEIEVSDWSNLTSEGFSITKKDVWKNGVYTIDSKNIGSVIKTSSINPTIVEDFDIDNPDIIRSIINYYAIKKSYKLFLDRINKGYENINRLESRPPQEYTESEIYMDYLDHSNGVENTGEEFKHSISEETTFSSYLEDGISVDNSITNPKVLWTPTGGPIQILNPFTKEGYISINELYSLGLEILEINVISDGRIVYVKTSDTGEYKLVKIEILKRNDETTSYSFTKIII